MNKKSISTIVITAILGIGLTSVVIAQTTSKKIVHPSNSEKYVENPEPFYKNNKDANKDSLLSEEKIREKIDKNQFKTKTSKIESVKLKTWANHIKEDDPTDNTISKDIDPEHMVWVTVTKYPDGLETKAGFYANATLISVFDSVTGDLIKSKVIGVYQGGINN